MTGKANFSDEEWEMVLEGPPSAGLLVSMAQRGGTFRESFSIAKAYTEARKQHGESELLDEIISAKPKVDRGRRGSMEELKAHHLKVVANAVALVESKASPEETEAYRRFVLDLAERVAAAKEEEDDQPVSEAERAAIEEIATTLS